MEHPDFYPNLLKYFLTYPVDPNYNYKDILKHFPHAPASKITKYTKNYIDKNNGRKPCESEIVEYAKKHSKKKQNQKNKKHSK